MKQDALLRVALWLVDLSSSGQDGEAFAGDLLEFFASGRSRWWCFAQAFRRTIFAAEQRLRSMLVQLWYCIGFVLLHPLWQRLYAPSVARLLAQYRRTTQWPGSAVLEIIAGLLPAMLFVWVGIFVYSLLRCQSLNIHPVAALLSLNVGACLLFLAIMARLDAMQHDLRLLSRADFYYPLVHTRFSILLFLSLLGAVLVLPRERNPRPRRHYLARLLERFRLLSIARSLGLVTMLTPQLPIQTPGPRSAAAKRLM